MEAALKTTTALISNLHCPSCVTYAEDTLRPILQSPATKISASIVSQTVTILHAEPLDVLDALHVLEDAGFDVDRITQGSDDENVFQEWVKQSGEAITEQQPKSHIENCVQCQADLANTSLNSRANLHSNSLCQQGSDNATSCSPKPNLWRATFDIEGMTCSSCVKTITDAITRLGWTDDCSVNLMHNCATVTATDSGKLSHSIVETINDLGYRAQLNELEPVVTQRISQERKITLQIDGMHCTQCPQRILIALKRAFGHRVEVESPPSLAEPRCRLVYVPLPPLFNIRTIMQTIEEVDKSFTVTVYHPPTLEERSKKMQQHHKQIILRKLIIALVAAVPTFVIGIVYMTLLPKDNAGHRFFMEPMWLGCAKRGDWILMFIATPVYFFSADFFHTRAIKEIWSLWRPGSRTPGLQRFYKFGSMDLLLSLGVTVAYVASIALLAMDASNDVNRPSSSGDSYFDTVVFLTLFLLIGRLLEAYSKEKAGDALSMLRKLRPSEASLVTPSGSTVRVPVDHIDFGDIVRIAVGTSPPFDGSVVQGEAFFDESSLTGESMPVAKRRGSLVFSGTVNRSGGAVAVCVSSVSGNSMLDQIIHAVREGQTRRAPVERIVDVLTGYFAPCVTYLAVLVWLVWLSLGLSGLLPDHYLFGENVRGTWAWVFWSLKFAVAVFVIACPCGIGLAAPTALFVGGGLAAKYNILVKGGGEAFQEASQLDCIVFDKTGTLTMNSESQAVEVETVASGDDQRVAMAALQVLAQNSSHPISRAIVKFCQNQALRIERVQSIEVSELPGKGMKGGFTVKNGNKRSETLELVFGNEALIKYEHSVTIPEHERRKLNLWKEQGMPIAIVAKRWLPPHPGPRARASTPWTLWTMIAVRDPPRPEAAHVIRTLQERGIQTWMLTGDNARAAHAVAQVVGIPRTNVIAGVLPSQKAEKIRHLKQTLGRTRRLPQHQRAYWWHYLLFALFGHSTTTRHSVYRHNTRSKGNNGSSKHHSPTAAQQYRQPRVRNGDVDDDEALPLLVPPNHEDEDAYIASKHATVTIAMVGDGINDSPALTAADVGIAIGSGSDIAVSSAAFVLVSSDLTALLTLVDLSRVVFRRIKFNFAWAVIYNLIALPVAAGVLYPLRHRNGSHVRLDPVWASLAMALSSVSVVLSSLLMRTSLPLVGFRNDKRKSAASLV